MLELASRKHATTQLVLSQVAQEPAGIPVWVGFSVNCSPGQQPIDLRQNNSDGWHIMPFGQIGGPCPPSSGPPPWIPPGQVHVHVLPLSLLRHSSKTTSITTLMDMSGGIMTVPTRANCCRCLRKGLRDRATLTAGCRSFVALGSPPRSHHNDTLCSRVRIPLSLGGRLV